MLASPAVRAAGERVGGLAAAGVCFCALFFGGGHSNAPLVWIGGLALVLSALLLALPQRLDPPAAALLLALVVSWALLAKCVPALYSDYGRIARLRAPLDYWNELALLCDA